MLLLSWDMVLGGWRKSRVTILPGQILAVGVAAIVAASILHQRVLPVSD